jgi:hypothetical protein
MLEVDSGDRNHIRALRLACRKAVGFPISPSPHPGGPPINFVGRQVSWLPATLQFAEFLLATPSHSARGSSGLLVAFVPVTVAGAAPAFHQLPSPSNKRLKLSQNKNLVSSEAHGGGPFIALGDFFTRVCKCASRFPRAWGLSSSTNPASVRASLRSGNEYTAAVLPGP